MTTHCAITRVNVKRLRTIKIICITKRENIHVPSVNVGDAIGKPGNLDVVIQRF